jgi:DNA mismatch repair protein MutL
VIDSDSALTDRAADGLVRVLPETLANKIAAGEVVQRPASALKELLENSIDAGARNVTVLLRESGSELIQVIDDGCGMGPGDALTCFSRHATSKIREVEDLERIRTLGFRGEALASIASVAHVDLKTRRQSDDAGTSIRVEGGEVVGTAPCAAPTGTSIAVRHLFFNVPARRNFLKTPGTEFKHLIDVFQAAALSHPQIGFSLAHDENEVFRLPPSSGSFESALEARLAHLLGNRVKSALLPLAESTSYLTVRGLVGRPHLARRGKGEQFLFVNDRFVRDRGLEHAVAAAFGGLIPEGSRPLFAVFLSLDPRHVDVNVHPTKTEVKFDDERGIYGMLRAVVKKALGDSDLVPTIGDGFGGMLDDSDDQHRPVPIEWGRSGGDDDEHDHDAGGPPVATPLRFVSGDDAQHRSTVPSQTHPVGPDDDDEELALDAEPPVWPLHGRYLVTPIRSGLLVVDQRLAHERILYEQALTAMEGGLGSSQQLVFPIILDLLPADHALLVELLSDLRSLGFNVEPFGGRTVKIHGVPADIRPGREQTILAEILEQYKQYRSGHELSGRENLARSFARRRAFRPGHMLSEAEARSLIDQLFACKMPYACPQGRATMVRLSIDELERRFGRF